MSVDVHLPSSHQERGFVLQKSSDVGVEDLQIVENMAESVATKSPDVLVVGADLAEAVKGGEPLAALDMFINTELEDVKEIKEGLSILSYTLTSPGLVRYVSLTD